MKNFIAFVLVAVALPLTAGDRIPDPATLDGVLGFLREHPEVSSVDALLKALPDSQRSQFTLLHKSRSLQVATPRRPRAILFGNEAKFVMTFSGDPEDPRYDTVEMFGFREKEAAFDFREVRFTGGPAEISARNPRTCLTCHTADPRPNWEHYNTWPGAFASEDDRFHDSDKTIKPELEAFLAEADKLPRYESLIGVRESYEQKYGRTRGEHNIKFTQRVAQLNWQRVRRLLRATPEWEKYKYAMLGVVACGDKAAEMLPVNLREKFREPLALVRQRRYNPLGDMLAFFAVRGIDGMSWSMDFQASPEKVNFITPGNHDYEFVGWMADGDPDLERMIKVEEWEYFGGRGKRSSYSADVCAQLTSRSLKALYGVN